jgi:hypothetical protein
MMKLSYPKFAIGAAGRSERLKQVVFACFDRPASEVESELNQFTLRDWQRILYWLDSSGLALYLLDQLRQLNLTSSIPGSMLQRFEKDISENRARAAHLFREASEISREMTRQGVSFALLKGITLTPVPVSDLALRWQSNLDFVVEASAAKAAAEILVDFGYSLHAVRGATLEFKAGEISKPDICDAYRVGSQRAVELHLLAAAPDRDGPRSDQLIRAQLRSFNGVMIPALSPADILVQQALHLFKHLCGEHMRASWVLEFQRHVQARYHDAAFWREVEAIAAEDSRAEIALGVSVLLATLAFGDFAPDSLKRRTVDRLPPTVRRWIEEYGMKVMFANSPGNKLCLILRQQLAQSQEVRSEVRRLIFPTRLPPSVTHGEPGQPLLVRLRRYRVGIGHLYTRACFQVREGIRYAIECARWPRRSPGITR